LWETPVAILLLDAGLDRCALPGGPSVWRLLVLLRLSPDASRIFIGRGMRDRHAHATRCTLDVFWGCGRDPLGLSWRRRRGRAGAEALVAVPWLQSESGHRHRPGLCDSHGVGQHYEGP